MKFSNGAGVKSWPCVVTFLLNNMHRLGVRILSAGFILCAPLHGHAQATINGTGAITGSGTAGAAAIGLSNAVLPDSLLLNWNTKVANSPSGGPTLTICATGCTYNNTQLQQAFNDIQCGQTLTIQENASYVLTSSLTLPAKDAAHNGPCTANSWITIESATNAANLPAEGSRITPCSLGMTTIAGLPAYACPGTPARHIPQLMEESLGSVVIMSGYTRLIGLEVTRNNDFDLSFGLANLGSNSTCSTPDLTCMNMQPDHVIFDRMIVHGDSQRQTTRAFNFGGARWVAVLDSYLYDITLTYAGGGGDAQVYGWGFGHDFTNVGFGKLANDFVNASAMSSIFCGAFVEPVSSATGFDGIPHDVWFSQQWLYKNPLWDTQIGATLNEAETIEGVGYGPAPDQEITVQPTAVQLSTLQQFQFQSVILNDSGGGINRAPGALPPTLTCGSSDCGTITANGEHTVGTGAFASQNQVTYTYTAPATIPTGGTVNVTFQYQTQDGRLATLGAPRILTAASTVTVVGGGTGGSASSAAANFYVSSTGSDSNDGSQAHPWLTIAHADSALTLGSSSGSTAVNCGDTWWAGETNVATCVHLAPGTYSGRFSTAHNGTSTQRIVFISDTRWGAAIVDGQSSFSEGDIWQVQASFQTFVGFDVSGNNSTTGFSLRGSFNHVLLNHVHDISSCTSSPNFCTVPDGGSGIATITTGGAGSTDDLIDSNVIHEIGPYANCSVCTASGSNGCNGVHGIYIQTANDKITNNIVYHSLVNGIVTFHGPTTDAFANNTVFANGCAAHGGGMQLSASTSGTMNNVSVINNIVFGNGGWGIRCDNLTSNSIVQNNDSFSNSGGNYSSCVTDGSDISVDPKFVNYTASPASPTLSNNQVVWSNADYHLQTTSPAINAGTTNCASGGLSPCTPTVDFDGNTRTGTIWIGPYQSASAGNPTHIVAVGPAAPDLRMQPSYSDSLNNSRQFEMEFNAIPNFASGSTTWSVDGVVGGNSSVGTIASQGSLGLYTSPTAAGTHSICAQASDGTQGCSSITVSASAPIVGFDLKPNTSKNAWELKCGSRVLLENSLAELAWGADGNGGGQPGYWLLLQTLNQANQTTDGSGNSVGYGPEHINDITVRYVKGEHFGFGLTVVPLNKSLGLHRVSLSNLVGDDINYQRWGNGFSKVMLAIQTGGTASTNILGWTSATSPVADNVTFKHITMLGNEMTPFGMVNNLAQFKLLNFTWQDSFFPAAGSATFTDPNGEVNDCDTASGSGTANTEINALVPCVTPYTFNHLALLDSTAAQNMFLSAPIWHPASTAVGFANYNGGNGGDYRLCSGVGTPASSCTAASPFAAGQAQQASDGTDLGADILGINVMESAVRSGVRTP